MNTSLLIIALAALFLAVCTTLFLYLIRSSRATVSAHQDALSRVAEQYGFDELRGELPADILAEGVPGLSPTIMLRTESGNIYAFFASNTVRCLENELTIVLTSNVAGGCSFFFWPKSRPLVVDANDVTDEIDLEHSSGESTLKHSYRCYCSLNYAHCHKLVELCLFAVDYINRRHNTELAVEVLDNMIWMRAPVDIEKTKVEDFFSDTLAMAYQVARNTGTIEAFQSRAC